MSLPEHRPLIVRSSRALGGMLVEKKLITTEQLDAANEKLLENIETGEIRRANILHVLFFDMQVLNEDAYLEAVVEKYGLGLIDLNGCKFLKYLDLQPNHTSCWATWTVPFDLIDDFVLLATLYYPSPPAVKFWQDKMPGKNLVWYATSVRSFQSAMDKLDQLKTEAAKMNQHLAATAKAAGHAPAPAPAPHGSSKAPFAAKK